MQHRPLRARLLGLLVVPFLLVATACGGESGAEAADDGLAVEHAQGTTTVPADPKKIVVLDIGALATLDGFGAEIVGVPTMANLPESLAKYGSDDYTKVGSMKEPDFEKVNSLGPDLIVVAGRSAPAYEELSKIAPTVDMTVENEGFMASFRARTEAMAKIFGKEAEATKRLDAIAASAEEVKGKADDRTGLVVLTTGGKISAFGPGSRFGLVHDVLGVQPADTGLEKGTHGSPVSPEFIAEKDPDLLYVVDRDSAIGEDGAAAKQVMDNALVNGTKAAKNDKIVYLDPFSWYIAPATPGSVEHMIKEVGDSLS